MSRVSILSAFGLAMASPTVAAAELACAGRIPEAFRTAFNAGDAAKLAALFAEDADFVNVGATHLAGRAEIEAHHAKRFAGPAGAARLLGTTIVLRAPAPGMALVLWRWTMPAYTDRAGMRRECRTGVLAFSAVANGAGCKVVHAQNSQAMPGPDARSSAQVDACGAPPGTKGAVSRPGN
jgi:uncharacterized protein (TIGR02246 family)